MEFKEQIELCIDEIIEDIFKFDIKLNAEYQRLKREEEQIVKKITGGFDSDMSTLFENYKSVIHAIAVIELHSVYKNGLKHGMNL